MHQGKPHPAMPHYGNTRGYWQDTMRASTDLADHVMAYLYNPRTGTWRAHDLEPGRPDIDHATRTTVNTKPARGHDGHRPESATTVTVGTMTPRQVNSGTATKTKGIDP